MVLDGGGSVRSAGVWQLLIAFAYAYQQGFVYHDVKPESLIVSPTGRYAWLILIFPTLRKDRFIYPKRVNTPGYLPLEQLRGQTKRPCRLWTCTRRVSLSRTETYIANYPPHSRIPRFFLKPVWFMNELFAGY